MMRTLTVKENLLFSALSRLPATMPRTDKRAFVNQVLATLGLYVVAVAITMY
jgi:hypothetical protein